jgi:osmotically-inducible protein OsmY
VQSGEVLLEGTVPTYGARNAAVTDAMRVAGVREVKACLTVTHPDSGQLPTDPELEVHARTVLDWNPDIDAAAVSATAKHGVITLSGTVGSCWRRSLAERLVGELTGVAGIRNELNVVPKERAPDEVIARSIMSALDRDASVDAGKIVVKVDKGVVTLGGLVGDSVALRTAHECAECTPGVRDIRNDLSVQCRSAV